MHYYFCKLLLSRAIFTISITSIPLFLREVKIDSSLALILAISLANWNSSKNIAKDYHRTAAGY